VLLTVQWASVYNSDDGESGAGDDVGKVVMMLIVVMMMLVGQR
jgi:hypothetical protein